MDPDKLARYCLIEANGNAECAVARLAQLLEPSLPPEDARRQARISVEKAVLWWSELKRGDKSC